MYTESTEEPEACDVLIVGTSLRNGILAAALTLAGRKVVHVDPNDFYGHINTTLQPPFSAVGLEDIVKSFSIVSGSHVAQLASSTKYNIELSPKLLYANSRLVQVIRDIGIGDYAQFKPLSAFYLAAEDGLIAVPSSKEDIFTKTDIDLITKRRLMKFIKFCIEYDNQMLFQEHKDTKLSDFLEQQFRLGSTHRDSLCWVLGQATTTNATVEQCVPIIRTHLHSLGIFGAFPVVVPIYGAGSELTQAFCRKAAVNGCTQMLAWRSDSTVEANKVITLDEGHRCIASSVVRDDSTNVTGSTRRFLVVEGDFSELMGVNDGVIIGFQPLPDDKIVVHCQIQGSALGICPVGQSVVYLYSHVDAPWEAFDRAQYLLCKHSPFNLITQVQYKLENDSPWTSYDSLITEAEEIFRNLVGPDTPFLPQVEQHDQEDDDLA